MNYIYIGLIICITVFYNSSYGQTEVEMSQQTSTDYSEATNWSIKCDKPTKEIDVFFVHPTTYETPAHGKYLASLSDTLLNQYTDNNAIQRMIPAFSESCNVFAPRYRQVNIEVLQFDEATKSTYLSVPQQDIAEALTFYLKKLNEGRPFILASHSQGSNVLQAVLLENPEIIDHEMLVAAYMPGWTFTPEILDSIGLKVSQSAEETGGLIVWNTIAPGGSSPTLHKNAVCVNPLSWTTDTNEVSAKHNRGAIITFPDGKKEIIPHFTAAKINARGGLEIPVPKPEIADRLDMSMGVTCYHQYDMDFFFENITENVALRCKQYLKEQK